MRKTQKSNIENSPFGMTKSMMELAAASFGTFAATAVLDRLTVSMDKRDKNGCYRY